jgi:hypothetical protein
LAILCKISSFILGNNHWYLPLFCFLLFMLFWFWIIMKVLSF